MEWKLVLDPFTGRYHKDLRTERVLQFKRDGWEKPQSFRLVDAHPMFNIAWLYWRDPLAAMRP